MSKVVCFGELLVDLVSQSLDVALRDAACFLKAPGGAPANVAVGLSRLGTSARFVGQVGDDPFGYWLRDILCEEEVDVRFLRHSPSARTTLALIATRRDGCKDVCFYRNPGADGEFAIDDLDPLMFAGARIFHCGGVALSQSPCRETQMQAARFAREQGLLVSFDPNWRPSLWNNTDTARSVLWRMIPLCHIVKLSSEEWEFFTGTPLSDLAEGCARIQALGPRLVVVTLGSDGAYFNCFGAEGYVEGFSSTVVDTLGAGDSFMAGLLHGLVEERLTPDTLNEESIRNLLRLANACGALTTRKAGAIPALPNQQEIEQLIFI